MGFRSTNVLVHSSGFAMEITRGCTGFAGAAVLIAGILSYPASSIERTFGIVACVPIFVAINLGQDDALVPLGCGTILLFSHGTCCRVANRDDGRGVLVVVRVGSLDGMGPGPSKATQAHPVRRSPVLD